MVVFFLLRNGILLDFVSIPDLCTLTYFKNKTHYLLIFQCYVMQFINL